MCFFSTLFRDHHSRCPLSQRLQARTRCPHGCTLPCRPVQSNLSAATTTLGFTCSMPLSSVSPRAGSHGKTISLFPSPLVHSHAIGACRSSWYRSDKELCQKLLMATPGRQAVGRDSAQLLCLSVDSASAARSSHAPLQHSPGTVAHASC